MGGTETHPGTSQFLFLMAKIKPLLRFINKQTENDSFSSNYSTSRWVLPLVNHIQVQYPAKFGDPGGNKADGRSSHLARGIREGP